MSKESVWKAESSTQCLPKEFCATDLTNAQTSDNVHRWRDNTSRPTVPFRFQPESETVYLKCDFVPE